MKLTIIALMSLFSSLAVAASAETVSYYFGKVTLSSADGKTPYGNTYSLVKRTISPQNNTIVEAVMQPPQVEGLPADEFITSLTRKGNSLDFDVSGQDKSFGGTITFSGEEWNWDGWTYSIAFPNGGTIQGEGRLTAYGIQTRKILTSPEAPAMQILEDLAPITQEKYEEIKAKLSN